MLERSGVIQFNTPVKILLQKMYLYQGGQFIDGGESQIA